MYSLETTELSDRSEILQSVGERGIRVMCLPKTLSCSEGLKEAGGESMELGGKGSLSEWWKEEGVDVLSFGMPEESKELLLAQLVIQKVRDPRTLAMCSCVNREWRERATDEELWRKMCVTEWPSLKSSVGRKIVQERGYRSFFSTRMQLDYDRVHKTRPLGPNLQLEDLVFFLDVVYGNTNIFSMVEEGQELAAKPSTANSMHENIFRFSAPFSEGMDGVIVPSSVDTPRLWTKRQIRNFDVTWSVMEKKSLKSIKLVQNRKGRMVGNSCLFESSLPRLSCFCHLTMFGDMAEVEIQFLEGESGCLIGRHVNMGTVKPECLRYQSRDQALTYLEFLFSREFDHHGLHQNAEKDVPNYPLCFH